MLPLLLTLAAAACDWAALARSSLSYREFNPGESSNVVAGDGVLYATVGNGLSVVDARTGQTLSTLQPAEGTESVDDLALAGGLLFLLDARPPGHLSVYSLGDPLRPLQLGPARPVPVGPFSGVSAQAGVCIVSGGTSELTLWRYDSGGIAASPASSTDLGRGQPDVLLGPDGRLAFVSTHYWGPYFGLDLLRYDHAARQLERLAELELEGAGFTAGGAKPANFPIEAALLGSDTLLVGYARGIALIDVASPSHPVLLATVDVGGPAVNVDALGTTALVAVAGSQPALVLLDFAAAPDSRVRRIPLDPGTFPAGVALTATHAAVALGDRGILVVPR